VRIAAVFSHLQFLAWAIASIVAVGLGIQVSGYEDSALDILFTLAIIVVVRLGAAITTPGVNQAVLQEWFRSSLTEKSGGGVAALFNLFSGGALENCAIFSLGIMPYISASIMLQLLTAVIPRLGRLAREDGGRQKIMQFTRYATVVLCLFQGYLLAVSFQHPESYHTMLPGITETTARLGIPLVDSLGWSFRIITVLTLTAGTLFLMWLGDQITDRGIGNGISLIITIGIVARLPAALAQAWKTFVPSAETGTSQVNPAILVLMVAFLFIVIAAVIAVTQGVRKITVQYAKRVVGRKMYGGQQTHLPLKINQAGVIPPIFASSILLLPITVANFTKGQGPDWLNTITAMLGHGQPLFLTLYVLLIIFFAFFYTSIMFNPKETAENLKKYGGFIPGIRPGERTAEYLDYVLTRITVIGALYLSLVCLLPEILSASAGIPFYFGGTSLLIVVSVTMDTVAQVQGYLLAHQYECLIRKSKLRGRRR
jgi:preprotein translocase subunit SecY